MKNVFRFTLLLAVLTFGSSAQAASRFWVGGTGTWDNATTTHWSASSGGAGGSSVPAAADAVTFDGSSGGGTVTVAATINGSNTLNTLTMGAFTGTLDFSANNPSITITPGIFSVTGTGARTLNLGSGTFTLSGNNANIWDATTTTSLTFNAGTSTIVIGNPANNNQQTFAGGGLTYGTLSVAAHASGAQLSLIGNNTFATFSMTGPSSVGPAAAATQTVTNALALNGTLSAPIALLTSGSNHTWAVAPGSVISSAALRNQTFTGTTVIATDSFDLKANVGVTITAPTTGGGGRVIGG